MIEKLDTKNIAELAALTTMELSTIQAGLVAAKKTLDTRKATFEALMLRNFETVARAAYVEAKKDTGTVTVTAPGNNLLALKVEVDKTVVWDQEKLNVIFRAMKPEDARHYAKLTYAVDEVKYKGAPPAVQTEFKTARTVKAGKMKFTFISPEVEAEAA